MFWRVICLCVLIFVSVTAFSLDMGLCQLALAGGGIWKAELNLSTADRLLKVLSRMQPEQRKALFQALSTKNLSALATEIRSQQTNKNVQSVISAHPGLDIIIFDLAEFGDAVPGIYGAANADDLVMRFLNDVRQKELESKIGDQDLLKTEAQSARLRRTLENSLINLIEQASSQP